jgi:hypothetical protein
MTVLGFLIHLLNFAYPAAAVALLVTLFSLFLMKKRPVVAVFVGFVAINFALCLLALMAGFAYFGNDAKMATHAAMLIASASCAWVLVKGWKK